MNGNELTEREQKILEEGNANQVKLMREKRAMIEQEAVKSGRYPLWLAVEMMTDNLKARWDLRDQLRFDAQRGRLPMFRKGDILPAKYRLVPLELRESDEYFWDDLNKWLEENEPRIKWQFRAPAAQEIVEPPTGDNSADDEKVEQEADSPPIGEEADTQFAGLFDPVTVAVLENMFPAKGKWKGWAEHASRIPGLLVARHGRAMFNPYLAGIWFAGKGIKGWDLARCHRTLANNLPARSLDSKHLLTGELE
jgi:hypothetical protein